MLLTANVRIMTGIASADESPVPDVPGLRMPSVGNCSAAREHTLLACKRQNYATNTVIQLARWHQCSVGLAAAAPEQVRDSTARPSMNVFNSRPVFKLQQMHIQPMQ